MNPKIFVGIAVAALAGIIVLIGTPESSLLDDVSDEGLLLPSIPTQISQIEIELEDIEILQINEKVAYLDVKFKVTNPNQKSFILKFIKYDLFEDDKRVHISTIGERTGGGLVGGSNYITVLSGASIIVSDEVQLLNTGNPPEFWDALTNNSPSWKIQGEAFTNLSSMTSGGENQISFELTK